MKAIKIEIDGDRGQNYERGPLTTVPKKSEMQKIIVTPEQRIELVEESLRFKELKIEKPNLSSIKNFYKKHHPADYEIHHKYNSWKTAYVTSSFVVKCTKKYLKNKSRLEDISATQEESRAKEELKKFLQKPTFKIDYTDAQKEQIIYKSIGFEEKSKNPRSDAVKWFLKEYHPAIFDEFQKFNNWTKCNLNKTLVGNWVTRFRERQKNPKVVNPCKKRKFSDSKINRGEG